MKKGFTLIELLVVISIIAILAVIGLAMFGNAQSNARDAKRRGDLDAIATALEQRYNPYTHTFPSALDSLWFQSGIPQDPTNSGDYVYTGLDSIGTTYFICAKLENANGNSRSKTDSTANASGSDAIFYCRKNLQAF